MGQVGKRRGVKNLILSVCQKVTQNLLQTETDIFGGKKKKKKEKESKEGLGGVCAWIFFIAITNVQDERTARKRKSPSRMTNSRQDTERSQPRPCPTVGLHDPSFSDVLLFKNFLQKLNMNTIKVVDYGGNDESGGSFSSNTELDDSKESSIILTVVLSVPQIFLPRFLVQVLSSSLHLLRVSPLLSHLQNYHQNRQVPFQIISVSALLPLSLSYPLYQKV